MIETTTTSEDLPMVPIEESGGAVTEKDQTNSTTITQADWDAGMKMANLFKLNQIHPVCPPAQTQKAKRNSTTV